MNGHRLYWRANYTTADAATLTALHTALQAPPFNFVPIGTPTRRTWSTSNVAASAMYQQGLFQLLCIDSMLYMDAMIRGSVDRTALKALITTTFGLTNETIIEDEAIL